MNLPKSDSRAIRSSIMPSRNPILLALATLLSCEGYYVSTVSTQVHCRKAVMCAPGWRPIKVPKTDIEMLWEADNRAAANKFFESM